MRRNPSRRHPSRMLSKIAWEVALRWHVPDLIGLKLLDPLPVEPAKLMR